MELPTASKDTAIKTEIACHALPEHAHNGDAFRAMIDALPVAIYATDAEGRLTHFNPAAAEVAGRVPQLGTERWCVSWKLYRPDGTLLPHDQCPMAVALTNGHAVRDEELIIERPDGIRTWCLPHPTPLRDADGRIVGGINMVLDITQRKQAEKALLESERHFRELIDSLPAAIYTTDAEGRLTHFNPACVELSGRTPELGSDQWCVTWKLYHPDGTPLPHDKCPMAIALKERRAVRGSETIAERPDGTRVWFEPYPTPLFDQNGQLLGGVNMLVDITKRKEAEIASARLAAIVESSDDAIVAKDLNGVITSWNRGAERLFGYAAWEAIGQPITLIIPPDRLHEEPQVLERIRRGDRIDHFETVRHRKDGSLVDISLSVSPVTDAQSRIVGASKIARDITDRKRTEEALREADLRKDEFLATLAHELRNPLAAISNAVQLLLRADDDPRTVRSASEILNRQVRHMVRQVDDLLDVSRIGRGKVELRKERTEVAAVVNHAVEAVRHQFDSFGHELTATLPPSPVYVHGDPIRLAQVVGNLLTNACKFTDKGGRIWLTVEKKGDQAVIRVRDSGIGIAAHQLGRIFEMFAQVDRSQERSREGLGLGLALVKNLVEMHGGTVEAHSPGTGQGSEFVVRLPLLARQRPFPQELSGAEPAATVPCRILVVDDNRDAAKSLALVLKLMGHEVHTAHDGLEAVEGAAAFEPHVILLDIGLPRLDGYQAARQIREQHRQKDLTLVALTGWGQEEDRRRSKQAGFDAHLVKPVNLTALSKLLAECSAAKAKQS